jgi:hydrogenase small subunit
MTHLIPYQPFRQQPGKLSRLKYYKLCDALAAALMLPPSDVPLIAEAVAEVADSGRLPVIWLSFQDCTGDTGSFLRSSKLGYSGRPQITDSPILNLLLDLVSLNYHGTPMVRAKPASVLSLYQALESHFEATICILEGGIPPDDDDLDLDGFTGGWPTWSAIQENLPQARAVIVLESCSGNGNGAAGLSTSTSASTIQKALPGINNLICLPGRPAAIFDLVASLVYLITFNRLPPVDSRQRPYFS